MLVVGSALLSGQDWSAAYQSVLADAEQIDAIEREIERELLPSLASSADQEASVRKLLTIDPELQAVWTALTEEADALYREGSLGAISAQQGVIDFAADFLGVESLEYWQSKLYLGQMLLAASETDSAAMLFSQAAEGLGKLLGAWHPLVIESRAELAQVSVARGEAAEAVRLLESLTTRSIDEHGLIHPLTKSLSNRVEAIQVATGRGQEAALARSTRCESIAQLASDWYRGAQECLLTAADLYISLGDDERAEQTLIRFQSIEAAKATASEESFARSDRLLAEIEFRSNRLDQALNRIDTRLEKLGPADPSALSLRFAKTRLLIDEGSLQAAAMEMATYADTAKTIWADDPRQLAIFRTQEAELKQRLGDLSGAEQLFKLTLSDSIDKLSLGDPLGMVLRNNLGQLYEMMGLFEEAEPLLKDAIALAENQLGAGHPETARLQNNLALLYESQGRFDFAEPLYESSIASLTNLYGEGSIEVVKLRNNLAFLQFMDEDFEAARTGFESVIADWIDLASADHPERLKSMNNLGRVLLKQGELERAEQQLLEVLALRQAKLGAEHPDVIRSRIDVGLVYAAQTRFDEAVSQLSLVLTQAEETLGDEHPYTFDALNGLAMALKGRGDAVKAIELQHEGFLRRTQFLDRVLWVTGENAREGYIRLHRPELMTYLGDLVEHSDVGNARRALEVSLMRKGLLLKITSEIQQITQLSQDPEMADLGDSLMRAREALARLTLSGPVGGTGEDHVQALNALEAEVDELEGELGRASARYRVSVAELSLDDVVKEIEPGSVLIDIQRFDVADEARYLAAGYIGGLEDDGFFLVDLGAAESIDEVIDYHRETIQDPGADDIDFEDAGIEAYETVFGQLSETVETVDHVYLIPDGLLNIAPFPAMMTADGEYLIERLDIQILTSARDLIPSERRSAEGEYVIVAGPDYDSTNETDAAEISLVTANQALRSQSLRGAGSGLRSLNFLPLPGAEREGQLIAAEMDSQKVNQTTFNRQAAEEAVVNGLQIPPQVLHIATHGFFLQPDQNLRRRLLSLQRGAELSIPPPGDNPLLRAGLAFAGINKKAPLLGEIDPQNDGVLTALEVLDLQLSGTQLVVLSACETGLGEIHEGEGVYGLRRAFQEAGVAEVVNSLWEVSDAGTQALMTAFYRRFMAGQSAREALRDAQLELKASDIWSSPFIWSAFMMVGSYDTSGTIQR